MGVYIPGLEMPKSCYHCKMLNGVDECCLLTWAQHDMYEWEMDQVQAAFCPLIPVPPHGRLIDADALEKDEVYTTEYGFQEVVWAEQIEDAPTVIPVEEGVE